ncbi:ATP-binding cassette domain-containing protein [Kribbella qitaiheensis]|uniref:ATP-binding cassette domain-containing protein n=1 Tax=Kribbella qitaiheensis TaxID=1544730 RepID=A0A7G6X554_9ACTN|nr:ATP-binding cassette domain-containing protein [Kribbella qitaiheensis]QNE21369.1 ATP-binding cassette domain-containing protein [Kribbella qitaiheensis]
MSASTPVVRLRQAGRRFGTHQALHQVDLTVHIGERVALLGASGAGKSTLLGLLNGSVAASEGTVEVFGRQFVDLSPGDVRALQRRIGTITQGLDLIEQVRVLHNINAGRLAQWSSPRAVASLLWPRPDDSVRAALRRVGMEWALHERTDRLSGGERQRVAIARLILQQPELILADEPVSSLDPARAAETLELLRAPGRDATLVVSLHQPALARQHCTRAVGLRDGAVIFDAAVDDLTADLLSDLYALA